MIKTTQMQYIMQNENEQQEAHGGQVPSILVVDDSVETLQIVRETLRRADYAVWTAISGEEALKYFSQRGLPHLAVVDINMPPGMDGFEFCERLYQFCDVPVIMLTAVDEADTVVNTIQQFAEDYVIKPFNPGELAARVRRVLQRVGKFPYEVATPVAVDSCLTVDFPARKVMKDHESSSLTPTEARLLYILMRDSGQTVETDFLLRRMWPREMTYEDRLHVYIHRLRNKLKKVDKEHQYVISERGIGYRFEPRGDAGG
jgi:DNA-binding response OmpR family regulator